MSSGGWRPSAILSTIAGARKAKRIMRLTSYGGCRDAEPHVGPDRSGSRLETILKAIVPNRYLYSPLLLKIPGAAKHLEFHLPKTISGMTRGASSVRVFKVATLPYKTTSPESKRRLGNHTRARLQDEREDLEHDTDVAGRRSKKARHGSPGR